MIGVTGIIGAVGVSGTVGIVSGSSGGTPPPSVGFTIGRYVDPPSGSVFYGFYRGSNTPEYGDLQPREFLSTGVDMTAISFAPNGFGTYACLIEFPDGSRNVDSGDIVVTVGEVEVTCIYDEDEWIDEGVNVYLGALPLAESQALVAYFDANENQTVPYTIEEPVIPSSQITVGTGIYTNGDPVAGYGINRLQGGGDFGSISPPLLLDGKVVTELSIRDGGSGYPNTITALGATNIGGLFLNIGDQTFTMSWAGRYGIPGGVGGQQQQQFYDFLVANDGAVLPISITDTALFSLVI